MDPCIDGDGVPMVFRFHQLTFHFVAADGKPVRRPIPLRVLRAMFLEFINKVRPDLATKLHDAGGIPPYTTRLQVHGPDVHVTFTLFSKALNDAIKSFVLQNDTPSFRLGQLEVLLLKLSLNVVDTGTFVDAATPLRKAKIVFKTPAYFKTPEGAILLYPLPEAMFKNLARIWNDLGDYEDVDAEALATWCKTHVRVTSHQLQTASVFLGDGRSVTGFTGWATIVVEDPGDSPFPKVLDMLLAFAMHANVGGNRTTGLGAIKYLRQDRRGTADPANIAGQDSTVDT